MLEAAARDRLREADGLSERFSYWQVYTLGYSVEMLLKCAWYRSAGIPEDEPLKPWLRFAGEWADAHAIDAAGTSHGHDLLFWSRLIIEEAVQRGAPLPTTMANRLLSGAGIVAGHWTESLRYRAAMPAAAEREEVAAMLAWLRNIYRNLWS